MSFDENSSFDHASNSRYPREAAGAAEWEAYDWGALDRLGPQDAPSLPRIAKATLQQRPRLFISHRSDPLDVEYAMRIREIAQHYGFTTWLDVLDWRLVALNTGRYPATPAQRALAVALIVEIALMNCSHVIVAMTPRTSTSQWVPYEYGRVKDPTVLASQAACWVEPGTFGAGRKMPEYLHLGPRFTTIHGSPAEAQLSTWLGREANAWRLPKASGLPGAPPAALP